MKKGCLLLLAVIFLIYGYQAYKVVKVYTNDNLKIKLSGNLSELTGKVVPIPLEMPDSGAIRDVKRVRQDGNNLFILSDNRLLHFDLQGRFINQITGDVDRENGKMIVEYVLDTNQHHALVIDSERNLNTFDYYGNLISSTRINHPWHKLTALIFHDGYLWATAETLEKNTAHSETFQITHKLYQLDLNMNELFSQPLRTTSSGMDLRKFHSFSVDELLVDEQGVYAYSTIPDTDILLRDTLHIAQQKKIPLLYKEANYGMACIYPVRKGKRYYLSTNHNRSTDAGFTFCYDDSKQIAYMLPDGFNDDLYKTGQVSDLQPMDIYNESYFFLKSGRDLAQKFPERAMNNDYPVLFLLKLNV